MEKAHAVNNELHNFLHFLYDGHSKGYAYMAFANPQDKTEWNQRFYNLSETDALGRLESDILTKTTTYEVFVAPAVFKKPRAEKEDVLSSNVLWTEFDGNAPSDWDDASKPSLIIQSSSNTHQHVYWRLVNAQTNIEALENTNRNITFNLAADQSAWDANQVLRPPNTFNHKRSRDVILTTISEVAYDFEVFNSLAPAPQQIESSKWELASLPDPQNVILKYAFGPDLIQLLGKSKPKDRSKGLMNLAYGCCELGMSDVEVFTMLRVADDLWEKFKYRKDRNQRLADIITRARAKHPVGDQPDEGNLILAFGFESFLATDIQLEWLIEPMLAEQGSMVFVGPSGVGKTQFSLQVLIHLALGKPYLHYKIEKPKKVLFLSLEMGHGELKIFLQAMRTALSDDEAALLEANFIVIPWGEPWALNKPEGQEYLNKLLQEFEPDGVFVDSIGSAISGNISDDNNVQPYTEYLDKVRKKYNVFIWAIHHLRKKPDGNHGYSQDDVYGNQYIFNRSTASYLMTKTRSSALRIRCLKMRLADKEEDHFIERHKPTLTFVSVNQTVDKKFEDITYKKPPEVSPGGIEL